MGLLKRATQFFVCQPKRFQMGGLHPDWETHPSWIAGIEGLNSYNQWVCEVVMPIAFQWIEEHKTEVYASIDEQNKDDVGVVIAAAFELVKTMSSYVNGLDATKQYEKELADGSFDPAGINPVWSGIAKTIREGTQRAYEKEAGVLKGTIR